MQNVEQTIINSAIKLFSKKGYAATSIRDIAKEVNITSATLYYYIDNKSDLLEIIILRYLKNLINDAKTLMYEMKEWGPDKQLYELVKAQVLNYRFNQYAALIVHTETRSLDDKCQVEIKQLRNDYIVIWESVLLKGKESGIFEFDNLKITIFGLVSLFSRIPNWYNSNGEFSIMEIADQFAKMALKIVKK